MDNIYVADFETTTNEKDCRVWGWGVYDIINNKFYYDTTIEKFFKLIFTLPSNSKLYFHNLKFDGEFIFYYLFNNDFIHSKNRKLNNNEFSTLITFMGVFYAINIMYDNKEYKIYDSLKIIPLSVKNISNAFNILQIKGEIDYTKNRPLDYQITENEIEYIKNDVEIVGKALTYFFNQKLNKMTQASNAFHDFKTVIGKKRFEKLFPMCTFDKDLRQSYKGGYTYVNPLYKNKDIKNGIVLDVNSLYPSVMYYSNLPYGEPIYYQGNYIEDKIYNVYIQMFRCNFELKDGFLPTLQLKNTMGFIPTEYVISSNNCDITLCLTSVDIKLFFTHYEVYNIEWFGGFKFKSTNKLFKEYIYKWLKIKDESTINGNTGMRFISKRMLNALYGKFALNPIVKSKIPIFDGELVNYVLGENEERNPVYIPVASFITSYSRKVCIESAQKNIERFIYADTDSLHLLGHKEPDNLKIDAVKLGHWKIEYKFIRGRFIRSKSYIEELANKELHIACAGLPLQCHPQITFDNFKSGLVVHDKLQQKRVKGGIILKSIDFTIKL